jgi:hypothetical protein
MADGAIEATPGRALEMKSWLSGSPQGGEVRPLAGDLSETVDDFMRLIVAMRHMDEDPSSPRWQAERAGFLALGRLRRSLTRACAARGLD